MKFFLLTVFVLISLESSNSKLFCTSPPLDIPKDWVTLAPSCVRELSRHVAVEVNASMTYLAMGAFFTRDTVNKPGFAETFFVMAREKREQAMKILQYLLMRGELTDSDGINNLVINNAPKKTIWESGVSALSDALGMESSETSSINHILRRCEEDRSSRGFRNDYHVIDYLKDEFLDEQHKKQRKLAGMVGNLHGLMSFHGPIGEFLFDKQIVSDNAQGNLYCLV